MNNANFTGGRKSNPINLTQVTAAISQFTSDYRLRSGGTFPNSLRIELTAEIRVLFDNPQLSGSNGIVFHYGFSPITGNICYLVGLGNQNVGNDFTNAPFPAGANNIFYPHYFLLHGIGSPGYKIVPDHFLKGLRQLYRNSLEFVDSTGAWQVVVADPNHPRMVFHEAPQLALFEQAYASQIPTHLYIRHGMVSLLTSPFTLYHQPLLLFGNSSGPFSVNNSPPSSSNRYIGRALDAGHACPPHCVATEYIRDDI